MTSTAELTLEAQLSQAGIPFEREYKFHPDRKWRADFFVTLIVHQENPRQTFDWIRLLVEIDGGAFIGGRHSRGAGVEADCEKTSAAAILGYRVLRMTPKQVEDGRGLQWIKQALGIET